MDNLTLAGRKEAAPAWGAGRAHALVVRARRTDARGADRLPDRVGWTRAVALGLTGGLAIVLAGQVVAFALAGFPYLGGDLRIYTDAAHRWLAGGGWYLPEQLAGPYAVVPPVVLYPPLWLVVLVPFAVGLPTALWWLVPAAAVAWSWHRLRPAIWSWPLILLCIVWPRSISQIGFGNPVIWVAGALWLGTVAGWPAVLVVLKPTVAPFALLGVGNRRWWLVGALLGLVSLPWAVDYATVLLNARTDAGWLYSVEEWPLLAAPIVAWVARRGS